MSPLVRHMPAVRPTRISLARNHAPRHLSARRSVRPVKALFNFGSRASSRPNQRASELEDEILSLVREVPVGKLSPKDADNFSDLVDAIAPLKDGASSRKLDGTYKFIYASRPFGPPSSTPKMKRSVAFDGSVITQTREFSVFGVFPGKASRIGDFEYTRKGLLVSWREAQIDSGPLGKKTEESGGQTEFTIYYASSSLLIFNQKLLDGVERDPVTIVLEKLESEAKPDGDISPTPRRRGTGRATTAEKKYKEQVGDQKPSTIFGRKSEAPKKSKIDPKKEAALAKRKAEENKRATEAEAKARKKQAEAEKAAELKKKEELEKLLAQLASNVSNAQQESRQAAEALRNATRENADALKTAQAAQKKIDAAETSVAELMQELEELNAAEKETSDDLRQAQRELQQSRP